MQNSQSASCARFPLALRFLYLSTTFRFCQELFSTVPKLLAVGSATPSRRSVSQSASCARYGSPCLGYEWIISQILPNVKHYFRFLRKWFLIASRSGCLRSVSSALAVVPGKVVCGFVGASPFFAVGVGRRFGFLRLHICKYASRDFLVLIPAVGPAGRGFSPRIIHQSYAFDGG